VHSRLLSVLVALVLFAPLAYGRSAARDPKKEQLICEQLASVAPGAVEPFRQATEAMDKEDYSQAIQLYREVTKEAPTFTPALRRLGMSLAAVGQTDEGLTLLENALKIEPSPENLVSLAQVLNNPSKDMQGTLQQRERALSLAKEAAEKYQGSDDPSFLVSVAHIALGLENNAEFRQATDTLIRKYPDFAVTHLYNAYRVAMDVGWFTEDEIREAERLGVLPDVASEHWHRGQTAHRSASQSAWPPHLGD